MFDPAFFHVTTLFFIWGFVTASIDPLVPSVRTVFSLTYAESMLTQFAFFLAYGLVSIPAAAVLKRLGYPTTIIASLCAMALGCLIMPLATHVHSYPFVLVALFIIAAGITQLQVAANPLAANMGSPKGSHFRLTLSQTFNSLGTVIAPLIGAYLVLRGGVFAGTAINTMSRDATLRNVDTQFLLIAGVIILLTLFLWQARKSLHPRDEIEEMQGSPFAAFTSRWALFGAGAIFVYVGAEVSIGSIMINFLHQPTVLAVDYSQAGRLLGFYWGGAMVGRAIGSVLLVRVPAYRLLGGAALFALALCFVVTQSTGSIEGFAAIAIGFFNSIMFPTIFTLTLERSSAPAPATSGLLCMAIVGGAVLPVCAGFIADHAGLATAFWLPLAAYAVIATFALLAASSTVKTASA
jgi:FHS family L-fucose permease-like MFS transporter